MYLSAPKLIKKYSVVMVVGLLIVLTLTSCSVEETFSNTDPSVVPKKLGDVIEWRLTKDSSPERVDIKVSNEWQDLDPQ